MLEFVLLAGMAVGYLLGWQAADAFEERYLKSRPVVWWHGWATRLIWLGSICVCCLGLLWVWERVLAR